MNGTWGPSTCSLPTVCFQQGDHLSTENKLPSRGPCPTSAGLLFSFLKQSSTANCIMHKIHNRHISGDVIIEFHWISQSAFSVMWYGNDWKICPITFTVLEMLSFWANQVTVNLTYLGLYKILSQVCDHLQPTLCEIETVVVFVQRLFLIHYQKHINQSLIFNLDSYVFGSALKHFRVLVTSIMRITLHLDDVN